MKKLFVILLSMTILLFSGCVYVGTDYPEYHNFTFMNNTEKHIADWYLKSRNGTNEARSDRYEHINDYSSSSLKHIRQGYYKVMYSYLSHPFTYHESNYFYLDSDTIFKLHENNFYEDK